MAKEEEKRFVFLKIFNDFFSDDIIDFIMSQENGSQYLALYLMLMFKTVNTGFTLERKIGEILIPYDIKQIAKDSKYFDVDTVAVALELFKQLGLVYESEENGVLTLEARKIEVGSYSAKIEAQRKRNQRSKKGIGQNVPLDVPQNVHKSNRVQSNRVTEYKSTDDRVQSTEKIHSPSVENVPYTKIVDMFHEICTSLPHIKTLSAKRKKALKKLYDQFSMADIQTGFEKAEASDFLTGRKKTKNSSWCCDFDWLIDANHFLKVVEGSYDNRKEKSEFEEWLFT